MGKGKPLILLGAAVVIALIAAFMTYGWLHKKGQTAKASTDTVSVPVAAVDLAWGTVLSNQVIRTVQFPKASVPHGQIPDLSTLMGRTLLYPVAANEPIFESRLAPTSVRGGGVAAVISPKKRAMAVKVDKVIGVSGFIHPANRVDVLVSIPEGKRGTNSTAITKIVLENMLVLAVGTQLEQAASQEKPVQVDVITLELTPEEGEKLALAASEGKLQMALRNSTDMEDVSTRGATVPTLLSSYAGGSAPKQTARKSGPPVQSRPDRPSSIIIELIKGDQAQQLTFGRGE